LPSAGLSSPAAGVTPAVADVSPPFNCAAAAAATLLVSVAVACPGSVVPGSATAASVDAGASSWSVISNEKDFFLGGRHMASSHTWYSCLPLMVVLPFTLTVCI